MIVSEEHTLEVTVTKEEIQRLIKQHITSSRRTPNTIPHFTWVEGDLIVCWQYTPKEHTDERLNIDD